MNLDRKFLEGFSEVSAANGLTPSQAHQLLTKEAGLGRLAGKVIKPLIFNKFMAYNTPALAVGGYFGGKHLLDKADRAWTDYGTKIRDYHNPEWYRPEEKISGRSTTAVVDDLPYYTKWDKEGDGVSSYAPPPTPTATTESTLKGKIPMAKTIVPSADPELTAYDLRRYQEKAELKNQATRKLGETSDEIAKIEKNMYDTNILNRNEFTASLMAKYRARKLEQLRKNFNDLKLQESRAAEDAERYGKVIPEQYLKR